MTHSTSHLLVLSLLAAACFQDVSLEDTAAATTTTSESATTTATTATTTTTSTTAAETTGETTAATTATTAESTEGDPPSTSTTGPASSCGDGHLDPGEECDLGPANADDGGCTTVCIVAFCGDGLVQQGVEECDLGAQNDDAAACTKTCKHAKCGDGLVQQGVEECDLGADNKAGVYDGCTPMTCTKGPHCGDDIVQKPQEECDDGKKNGEASKCAASCTWNGKIIFATSKSYSGAFGGLAGADDKCNTLAMEAGLANAGAFLAWVSNGLHAPATRMVHWPGRYLLLDGTVLANNWDDLTDGTLAAPIDRDEAGALIVPASALAWTGVLTDGDAADPDKTCVQWTSADKAVLGRRGNLAATNFTWTSAGDWSCALSARIICVEQ